MDHYMHMLEQAEIVGQFGDYKFRIYVSDPRKSEYTDAQWRYEIKDPTGKKHPGRLTGATVEYAAYNAMEDIRSFERRSFEAKAKKDQPDDEFAVSPF